MALAQPFGPRAAILPRGEMGGHCPPPSAPAAATDRACGGGTKTPLIPACKGPVAPHFSLSKPIPARTTDPST